MEREIMHVYYIYIYICIYIYIYIHTYSDAFSARTGQHARGLRAAWGWAGAPPL